MITSTCKYILFCIQGTLLEYFINNIELERELKISLINLVSKNDLKIKIIRVFHEFIYFNTNLTFTHMLVSKMLIFPCLCSISYNGTSSCVIEL